MYHRLLHKYKEFEGQDNVIVGQGELIWLAKEKCWLSPTKQKFYDKQQAIEHAKTLDKFYHANKYLKCWRRNVF